MKQTAVEWLYEEFTKTNYLTEDEFYMKFNQAKEMEKEQIINSYRDGRSDQQSDRLSIFYNRTAEQYYKETFNNESKNKN
jgi:hypothetical protein